MTYIKHHGVLGQKWGIRRFQNPDGTLTELGKKKYSEVSRITSKNGDELFLAKKHGSKRFENNSDYEVIKEGKKIGNLFLENHGDDLYVNWINIKSIERGKGYANAAMDYVIKYSIQNGFKSISLEVPKSSPDAKHIYEKHDFKESGNSSEDLIPMIRKIFNFAER